jgi:hypothetical protein
MIENPMQIAHDYVEASSRLQELEEYSTRLENAMQAMQGGVYETEDYEYEYDYGAEGDPPEDFLTGDN